MRIPDANCGGRNCESRPLTISEHSDEVKKTLARLSQEIRDFPNLGLDGRAITIHISNSDVRQETEPDPDAQIRYIQPSDGI
ncbi:hypothetical protein X777_16982 [Ooceraea biroi]|uniref:Uncharacterized protein n=1 Tax=Ooceraea biroi TaxID=2015173 RepID=A0A026WSL0_OOCBI|nr:hypothetical protein X777_16982 [Ooceraea biroi]